MNIWDHEGRGGILSQAMSLLQKYPAIKESKKALCSCGSSVYHAKHLNEEWDQLIARKENKMAKQYENKITRLTNLFPVKGKGKLMIGSIRGEYFDNFTDEVYDKAVKKKRGISFFVNKFGDDWVLSATLADKFKGKKRREREEEEEEENEEEEEEDEDEDD